MFSGGNVHVLGHSLAHTFHDRPTSKGFEVLTRNIAAAALHNSSANAEETCQPGTRESILGVLKSLVSSTRSNCPFTWFYGSAGAGKTAIVRTLAERLAKENLLLADFFHSRADSKRNSSQHLISTLSYQVYHAIPSTRPFIEEAITSNPLIFSSSLERQLYELIIIPMNRAASDVAPGLATSINPHVILIDALDECVGEDEQHNVLDAFSQALPRFPYPISILIASRPEENIRRPFDTGSLIHCSTPVDLDETFNPDADIRQFYDNKFSDIRFTHPLRSLLPNCWPHSDTLRLLVRKASGQFIFSATVIKFVRSIRHNPLTRLEILLRALQHEDIPQKPFETLDIMYSSIIHKVNKDDLPPTLRILGILLQMDSENGHCSPLFIEEFLDLQPGTVRGLFVHLSSLVRVADHRSHIKVFHKSLIDFFFNRARSGVFFINQGLVYADLSTRYLLHPMLPTPDQAQLSLPRYFGNASPTSDLHDTIVYFRIDSIISSPDFPLAYLLKDHSLCFWDAIRQSSFQDAYGLAEQFRRKWVQALTPQVMVYLENPGSTMLFITAARSPSSLACLGHLIYLLNPLHWNRAVQLDRNGLKLLESDGFYRRNIFNYTLQEIIITIYGRGVFTDCAIQLWGAMLQDASQLYQPGMQLANNLGSIPGIVLDQELASYANHGDHAPDDDTNTLGHYIRILFPRVLDVSSVRTDLTMFLTRESGKEIQREYQTKEISAAISGYLERANFELDCQLTETEVDDNCTIQTSVAADYPLNNSSGAGSGEGDATQPIDRRPPTNLRRDWQNEDARRRSLCGRPILVLVVVLVPLYLSITLYRFSR